MLINPQDRNRHATEYRGFDRMRQGGYNPNGSGARPLAMLKGGSKRQGGRSQQSQDERQPPKHSLGTTAQTIGFPPA